MRSAPSFFSRPLALLGGAVALLGAVYIALIAVIMTYAALTVELSESVHADEAAVAALEASYLGEVSALTATDYTALGYQAPVHEFFVRQVSSTALR